MSITLNQFNRRSAVSFVLAILLLTTAATPALAWFEEGIEDGQASLPCRVIEDVAGDYIVYCTQPNQQRPTVVVKTESQLRPSIAKAELMTMPAPQFVLAE